MKESEEATSLSSLLMWEHRTSGRRPREAKVSEERRVGHRCLNIEGALDTGHLVLGQPPRKQTQQKNPQRQETICRILLVPRRLVANCWASSGGTPQRATTSRTSTFDQLQQLMEWQRQGLLSEVEFQRAKDKILGEEPKYASHCLLACSAKLGLKRRQKG